MKLLEERIQKDGRVLPENILKVDSFLNHQIDPELFMAMGKDFYEHFKGKGITKILTLEVSGIAIAFAAATFFNVPLVFAKKCESLTISDEVYAAKVLSYTKQKTFDIRVQKNYLSADDKVLIIDDFLAMGEALTGLVDLCQQAESQIVGMGIAIEKCFQPGGQKFRQLGYDVYSQAMVKSLDNGCVTFVKR